MAALVRWGILGTGLINRRFLAHAGEATNAEFVAVGSRTPDRAAAFASEYGIERAHGSYDVHGRVGQQVVVRTVRSFDPVLRGERAHGSYDDLLADPAVDVVYICLPNGLHHAWTMRALAAGKHVLCEKPYSRRPAEVVEAFDAAAAAGLLLMEGFMWRHTPQARRFMEVLPEIGELQVIRATFSFRMDGTEDVRLRPDLDGGSLMDVGCYCVSGARMAVGFEPETVYGEQVVGPSGVDVRFAGLLRFPDGPTASIVSGFESDHATLEAN